VEETTNINEYDNNPINRISYEDEKIIFNNSNPKNTEYIFNNKILNNSNEIINIKENVIEKNGELFYPVDESINLNINKNIKIFDNQLDGNEEEEIDINGKNEIYFKIRIVDNAKRLISFLFFPENNNRKPCDSLHRPYPVHLLEVRLGCSRVAPRYIVRERNGFQHKHTDIQPVPEENRLLTKEYSPPGILQLPDTVGSYSN
jgi:hypothetical protein